MKIIKILIILSILTSLMFGLSLNSTSIGKLWAYTHINSLIGLQKLVEKLLIFENNSNIWINFILPILELNFFFIFSIILFIILIIILIKSK